MARTARKTTSRPRVYSAKSVEATRLRKRKHELSRRFGIPHELLGGSLNQVHRRCGKAGCHCESGEGHPMWTLTYSVRGRRHVEFIPDALVPLVAPLAEQGRAYRDAVGEIVTINAQLLTLWRRDQRVRPHKKRGTDRRSGT